MEKYSGYDDLRSFGDEKEDGIQKIILRIFLKQ